MVPNSFLANYEENHLAANSKKKLSCLGARNRNLTYKYLGIFVGGFSNSEARSMSGFEKRALQLTSFWRTFIGLLKNFFPLLRFNIKS